MAARALSLVDVDADVNRDKMNISEIWSYKRPKESLYDILGCSQSSSVSFRCVGGLVQLQYGATTKLTDDQPGRLQIEQINREYKIKALHLHPDKNPDPESVEKFRKIQQAKEILTDAATRKLYDTWLNSGINIPFEQFQAKRGHSMHWAPPRRNVPLGLRERSVSGQGSELINDRSDAKERETNKTDAGSMLDKFRRYEI